MVGALSLAVSPFGGSFTEAATDPRAMRPQIGDRLVNLTGEHAGKTIAPDDLRAGEGAILAYPMDPATQVVRDKSRLNVLVLARLATDEIGEDTRPFAADGVVSYSTVCTHNGCVISDLRSGHDLLCNCHGSTFDAGGQGKVVVGPATRRLAILPLKLVDGSLAVAASFIGRLGPPQD